MACCSTCALHAVLVPLLCCSAHTGPEGAGSRQEGILRRTFAGSRLWDVSARAAIDDLHIAHTGTG